jgi:hypothetical protein
VATYTQNYPQDEDFDTFWRIYPLKVSKGDARKAWFQTSNIRPSIEEIAEAIERYVAFRNASEFLSYKYPATWIRSECWADVYEVPKVVKDTRPSITCMTCKEKSFTWKAGRCDPCWHKYMGTAA